METGKSNPLQRKWTLYYDRPSKTNTKPVYKLNEEYKPTFAKVYSFDTVEDFFRLHNTIKTPKELPEGVYYIFKEGVEPKWEDPMNATGGMWLCNFHKDVLDDIWLSLALGVIGEQFSLRDEINGLALNIRKYPRIEIWTCNAENANVQKSISHDVQKLVGRIGGEESYNSFKKKAQQRSH